MRFAFALNSIVGAVLVLPALQSPQARPSADALERQLFRTARALDQLAELQRAWEDAPRVDAVLAATDPASTGTPHVDGALDDLRREVAWLQSEIDRLEAPPVDPLGAVDLLRAPRVEQGGTDLIVPVLSGSAPPGSAPSVATTGLDSDLAAALRGIAATTPGAARALSLPVQTAHAREPDGYSADRLLEGRALCRAGRWAEALETFEGLALDGPQANEVLYWRARALEHLARESEALELYRRVLACAEGDLAVRAARDAEFLEWKLDFARRLEERTGGPR